MVLKRSIETPIIVTDPLKKEVIDIAPLFDALDQLSDETGTFEELQARINNIIRLVIISKHLDLSEIHDWPQAIQDIWIIQDLFLTITKKKGY